MLFWNSWRERERKKQEKINKRFEKQLAIETRKADERAKDNKLRELRQSHRYFSEKRKKFTTTKLLMYLILINCTAVELYSMWIMYHLSDLSALYSLIGAVVGESLSYAIYCAKSFNETKEEVKTAFEREKFFFEKTGSENTSDEEVVFEGTEDENIE